MIENAIVASENGIVTESIRDDAKLSLIDNVIEITDDGVGIMLRNIDSSEPVLVRGGSTNGGSIGLAVIQEFDNVDGKVIVDGLVVNQASEIGLLFQTLPGGLQCADEFDVLPGSKSLEVMLMNAVTVNGGSDPSEIGMVFDGLGLSLTGDTLADTRFAGTPGKFIVLRNGALFEPGRPTLIDGTGVYWDGLDANIPVERQQIINRIIDFLDDPTLGLIFPGAAPGAAEQNYDRFTRYQDWWRTVDTLMGPFPVGSITYRTPIIDVAESLEDQAEEGNGDQSSDQAADETEQEVGIDLAVK